MNRIRKNDLVIVTTGKDKGKKGKVIKVFLNKGRALVEGINLAAKHQKPTQSEPGKIFSIEMSVDMSNLAHIDPKTGLPTKISYEINASGKKIRVSKKSGLAIDKE